MDDLDGELAELFGRQVLDPWAGKTRLEGFTVLRRGGDGKPGRPRLRCPAGLHAWRRPIVERTGRLKCRECHRERKRAGLCACGKPKRRVSGARTCGDHACLAPRKAHELARCPCGRPKARGRGRKLCERCGPHAAGCRCLRCEFPRYRG